MRGPTKKDDELLQTIQIGVNTSVRNRLAEHLNQSILNNPNDAEARFAFALFHWVLMPLVGDSQLKHKCLVEIIERSSQSIELNNEHWLALFFRSMVRLMMNDDADEMATYLLPTDYSGQDALDDQHRMIKIQEPIVPSPYCAIPYVQLAYASVIDDNLDLAMAALQDAVSSVLFAPIPHFGAMLRYPFLALYKKAYSIRYKEMVSLLRDWIVTFFPSQRFNER